MVQKTSTVKVFDIYGSGVIQIPVVADLDVKDLKVTGVAHASSSVHLEVVKTRAVADALKNAKADVLVEPKFETETKAGKTTAIVTGWPANYINFRPIEFDDIELIKAGIIQKAEVYEPSEVRRKR